MVLPVGLSRCLCFSICVGNYAPVQVYLNIRLVPMVVIVRFSV